MLQTLKIENFALIENQTVEFKNGLNILLGETGSGKSLIFNSILFALGMKADKTYIRSGKKFMKVDALFVELSDELRQFLEDAGFDCEDELLLSRSLSEDGKNVIRVNGQIATTSMLKEIGQRLVDSFTQHESVSLLNVKNHLTMLDKFAGERVKPLKEEISSLLEQIAEINKKIKSLGGDESERERLISLLKYQYEEIEKAGLRQGEDEEVKERLKVMASAEKIFEAVSASEALLSENPDSAINALQEVSNALSALSNIEVLSALKERLDSCRYELEDIVSALVDVRDETTFDEGEFNALDQRNDLIKNLCKKYGGSIEAVLEFASKANEQLQMLDEGQELLEKLNAQKEKLVAQLEKVADKLTEARKVVAEEVEGKVEKELRELGMKSSKFTIQISPLKEIGQNGRDDVVFNFSANAGQEVKSLSKTASGGELSRFMLAVKNIFAENGLASTLLFDEIDAGISGETGKIVGQKLKNITKFCQVLCITHLPQVAVFGDNFVNVYKLEKDGQTFSETKILDLDEAVEAVAKMTGGANPTEIALNHAREMFKDAR